MSTPCETNTCPTPGKALWKVSAMDLSKERKWSKLRGRLHMLGYNQYLGAESVPLVEELFSDLVHTTESLRNSQQSTVKSEKESQNCDVLLARQNQDLELELMMVKSEKAHVTKELKAYITKLDEEIGLQKSLNKQHVQKIHSLEQECNEKARIIHQLSGKIAEVQAVDIFFNFVCLRACITLIDELQTTNNTLEQKLNAAGQKSSSKVAELTSKNHELCQEITDIRNLAKMMEMEKRQKLKTAKTEVQDLKDIIHKHKDVIKDLEAQLGKKRTEVIDPELIKSQLGDELGNLREQNEKLKKMVDFLSVEKSRLQDKLQKMMSIEKVLVLELEGWRTKYGICGKDRLPSRLDAFVKSLEEERDSYRLEAEHSRNIRVYVTPIYSSDMKSSHGIENVQQEPDVIRKLKEELRRVEENLQQHNLHIQDEISNLKEDKTSEDKIEQELAEKVLLAKELQDMQQQHEKQMADANVEILQLKQKLQMTKEKMQELEELKLKQTHDPETSALMLTLKENLKKAEEKVEQVKSEKDTLKEELKQQKMQHEQHNSNTFVEIADLKEKLRVAEKKIQQQKQNEEHISDLLKLKEKIKMTEDTLRQVKSEKDRQMEELKVRNVQQLTAEKDSLTEELKQKIGSHTSGDISDLKEKLRLAEEKIQKLTEEKDSQHAEWEQKQLQHYKQSANKSAEILQLKKQLRQAEEQLLQVTAENNSLAEELKKLRLTEEKILQVTAEKDSLMEELQLKSNLNISEELSKLKEKVRLAEEKLLRVTAEKVSLEEELKLKQENLELHSQVLELQVRERNVERQMDTRSAALVQNAEESPGQRTAASGFRRQQDQIQDALLDLQQMLSVKTDELHDAHSQMEKLEDIIESLSKQLYQHRQDAKVFQISYSALCFKKDVLQEDVAKKTKRLAVLHEQLSKKVNFHDKNFCHLRCTNSLNIFISKEQLDFELKSHDRAMATHRMLENHQETLGRLKRDNELIIGEYRRLQDDMAAITEEKQHALMEKGDALRERDELKQRMNSYVDTVARIENILKTKDQENLDLLERIRTAHSDLQVREHRLKCAEDLNGSIRLELLLSEKERQNLCEALGHKEQEVKELMQDLQTYKAQAATLAHGMSQLEAELRVLQEEKVVLLAELATVRDVCVKLDSDKEIAAQQLLQKSMELERATSKQEDALSEAALLKEHLASEKLTLRNMEAMLSTSRKEMFQAHQAASDKEAELTTLRHKLTQADNKIMSHAREVTTLRGKVTQLQTQMEVLTSKVLEREGHHGTSSQEISFMPKRASSPIDHADVPHQMDPYNSVQEEISFGPTSQKIPGDPGLG
nr:centrosomal protein of 135 kDa-like [Nerophis lumbriciformis]